MPLRWLVVDMVTPVHASLFGSFARREATTTSDIDIPVVVGQAGAADQDARAPR